MRRQRVVLAASLCFACAVACCQAAEQTPPDAEDLIFWTPGQPVFLRLSLIVGGQSYHAAWNAAVGRLFDAFDRDGDGTVASDEELGRLLALVSLEMVADPAAARRAETTPLALRREEMPSLLESRSIGPFCIAPAAAPQAARSSMDAANELRSVANDLLFSVLDENHSGDLSAEELLLSRRRKLDLDDDGCLSARELQMARIFAAENLSSLQAAVTRTSVASAAPAPWLTRLPSAAGLRLTARELLARYDDNRDGMLAIDELAFKPPQAATFDQDRNGRLDLDEMEQMLRRPAHSLALECRWPAEGSPSPRTVALGDQAVLIELSAPPAFDRDSMLKLFDELDGDRNQLGAGRGGCRDVRQASFPRNGSRR